MKRITNIDIYSKLELKITWCIIKREVNIHKDSWKAATDAIFRILKYCRLLTVNLAWAPPERMTDLALEEFNKNHGGLQYRTRIKSALNLT